MQSLEYSKNSEQKLPSFLKIALSYSDVIKGSFKLKKKKKKQKEIVTLLQKAILKIWTACFSLAFSSVLNKVLQIQVQHCCPSCSRAVWALGAGENNRVLCRVFQAGTWALCKYHSISGGEIIRY